MFLPKLVKKSAQQSTNNRDNQVTPALIRVQKDLSTLTLPQTCSLVYPNGPDDVLNFTVVIKPEDGNYKNGVFNFSVIVSEKYPYEAPKVRCLDKIYHPNIDLKGAVCLNILRDEWKPVLNIEAIILGLYFLFCEQNADDPLNHEAAAVYRSNMAQFLANVKKSMAGGEIGTQKYDNVLVRK